MPEAATTEFWKDLKPIQDVFKPDGSPRSSTGHHRRPPLLRPAHRDRVTRPLFISPSQNRWCDILMATGPGLVNRHYHPHQVFAFTLSGKWGYLEHDSTATAGDFLYEAPGEDHTLVAYEHEDPMRIFFNVTGPLIWLDENGEPEGHFDVHDYIALAKAHYEQVGLGAARSRSCSAESRASQRVPPTARADRAAHAGADASRPGAGEDRGRGGVRHRPPCDRGRDGASGPDVAHRARSRERWARGPMGNLVSTVAVGDPVLVCPPHTCGLCVACRRGRDMMCEQHEFTGLTVDGRFAGTWSSPSARSVPLPVGLDPVDVGAFSDAASPPHRGRSAGPPGGPAPRHRRGRDRRCRAHGLRCCASWARAARSSPSTSPAPRARGGPGSRSAVLDGEARRRLRVATPRRTSCDRLRRKRPDPRGRHRDADPRAALLDHGLRRDHHGAVGGDVGGENDDRRQPESAAGSTSWELLLQLRARGKLTLKTRAHSLDDVNDVLEAQAPGGVTGRAVPRTGLEQ